MNEDYAITIKGLSKQYIDHAPFALKNLSINVRKGEIYGFLGPNGAGKSTTIRLLLNFIQPTSGSATIHGYDCTANSVAIKRHIGYLAGDFKAYEKMTGAQFLKYMHSLQTPKRFSYTDELARMFHVNTHKKLNELSKGNKQKIGIIQALMHEPEILILDEPTIGLDPLMQEVFYSIIRKEKNRGTTVFVSSHNLSEVRKICDRVGIIKDGLLVSEQSIAELAQTANQTLEIMFESTAPVEEIKAVEGVKNVKSLSEKHVSLQATKSLTPIFAVLAKHKVLHIETRELNLEQEFMKFYKTKGRR